MVKSRNATALGLFALEPRQMYDGAGALSAAAALKTMLAPAHATTLMHGKPGPDHASREVVFIDGGIPNVSQLVAAVETARPGARVAVLDPKGNEVAEIAAYVAGLPTLDAIHVISHGAAGQLDLGSQIITDASLAADAPELAAIGRAVKPGGEILLYGCDVAQGKTGARFIDDIAAETGRVVTASVDDTGAASRGGNWVLEASTGARSVAAIDATGFDGLLVGPTITGLTPASFTGSSAADLLDTATADATPTITGTAGAGDSLIIQIDTTSLVSPGFYTGMTAHVTANALGVWSYTFQAPLPVGTHAVVVFDSTTNASSSAFSIAIDTPPSIATTAPGQGAYSVTYDQSGAPILINSITLVGESTNVADDSYNAATGDYNGKYFQAQVTAGGSGTDSLSFAATPTPQGSDPSLAAATQPTALGVVSVSGGIAYLGDGTAQQQIGTVTGSGTSDLRVTFTSNLVTDAVVQSLARMVLYSNGFGSTGTPAAAATVTLSLTDNTDANVQSATTTITYENTAGADSAPVITLSSSAPISVTNGAAQSVDPGLTVSGNPASNLVQATVLIENVQSGDVLGWNAATASANGMSVSYNAATGTLLATSTTGNTAGYQAFLRSVTFSTTSTSTVPRTIDISLGAGLYYSADGHFYEYVADNGVSYQQAEVLASQNHLYGLQGYLATITSAQEDAFIANQAGDSGWLGASDAPIADTAAGAADSLAIGHWHWNVGPEGLIAAQADGTAGLYFFQQDGATVLNGDGSTNTGESGSISGQLYGFRNLRGGSNIGSNYSNWQLSEPNNITGNGSPLVPAAGTVNSGEEYAHIFPGGQWNDYNANQSAISGYVVEFGGMPGDTVQTFAVTKTITVETSVPAPVITGLTAATDTGSSSTDGITSNQTPTVMGTTQPNATITVYQGSTVMGTATADSAGNWTLPITTTLAPGTHDFTAQATLDSIVSTNSNTYAVVIETSAPAPVITGLTAATDTGTSSTDGITSDTTPTVTGTGEAGDTLTLSEGTTVLGTATVAANGSWTLPLATALTAGTHDLTATETDPAGVTSAVSTTYAVVIETSAPAPVITGLTPATDTGTSSTDGITSDTTPTVTGTGEAGDIVTLSEGTTVLGTATVAANGSWTLPLATALTAGTHDLTATETDPAGVTSAVSTTHAVVIETSAPAPVITGLTAATDTGVIGDGLTSDRQPALTGTTVVGSVVTIYDGTAILGTTTANAAGAWYFTPSNGLADGSHSLSAIATDPVGVTGPRSAVIVVQIVPTALEPIAGQVWSGGGAQKFALPAGVFSIPSGDVPVYAAQLVTADGTPAGTLPNWMHFETATGTFVGAVPTGVNGVFHIEITVTDNHGDRAHAVFALTYDGPSPTQAALMAGPAPIVPILGQAVPRSMILPQTQLSAATPENGAQADRTDTAQQLTPPIEESLTAIKPQMEVTVPAGSRMSYTLGADTFDTNDPTVPLILSATLADGRPLPSWLMFDPLSGTLSGQAPAQGGSEICDARHPRQGSGVAMLDLLITARDSTGHAAYAHVRLNLPRSPTDGCATHGRHSHAFLPSAFRSYGLAVRGPDEMASLSSFGTDPARPGFSAQIRANHPGARLISHAAFLRAAERMLEHL